MTSTSSQTKTPSRAMVFTLAGFALLAAGLDQLTKFIVISNMAYEQRIPVIPPVLSWFYVTNPGAAFSIGEGYAWVFALVMIAVSLAIIWYARKVGSLWWAIALGLVLGGALGNLYDRLFRPPGPFMGHVVDFIAVPNFAVFNLADCAVVGGVILICILTLLGIPLRGGPREGRIEAEDAEVSDPPEVKNTVSQAQDIAAISKQQT